MFQKTSDVHIQNSFVNPAKILSGFLLSHTSLHLLQNGTPISACCYGHTIRQACTFFWTCLFMTGLGASYYGACISTACICSSSGRSRQPPPRWSACSRGQRCWGIRACSLQCCTQGLLQDTQIRHLDLAEEVLLTLVSVAAKAEHEWAKTKKGESQETTFLESKLNAAFCKVSSTWLSPCFWDAATQHQRGKHFNSRNRSTVKTSLQNHSSLTFKYNSSIL